MPFLYHFHIPNYQPRSNGISLLWKAAHLFSQQRKTTVTSYSYGETKSTDLPENYENLRWQGSDIRKWVGRKNVVTIYPENITNNPLGAINVARYLMAKPMLLNTPPLIYTNNEFYFAYSHAINDAFPQYNLLSSNLTELKRYADSANKTDTLCVYLGKIRLPANFKPFRPLLDQFKSVEIITRTYPRNRRIMYEKIAGARLLLSFDPLTSILHESTLLGTPVLIADDALAHEYTNYNYPLPGFCHTIEEVHKLDPNFSTTANKILAQQVALEDAKTEALLNQMESFFNQATNDVKKINDFEKIEKDYTFFSERWNYSPVYNFTGKRSIYMFHLLNSYPGLFSFLYRTYISFKSVYTFFKSIIWPETSLRPLIMYLRDPKKYKSLFPRPTPLLEADPNELESPLVIKKLFLRILWRL